MTVKSALRFLIAAVIWWVILSFALPQAGIARSRMLPAPLAYAGSASKTAQAYIAKKDVRPSSNIFRSSEKDYLVDYQFRAPGVPGPGNVPPKEKNPVYKGTASIDQAYYDALQIGQVVPVKYDPTDPEISAITAKGGGRNIAGHGSLIQIWVLVWIATAVLAYILAPWLERIILRENY